MKRWNLFCALIGLILLGVISNSRAAVLADSFVLTAESCNPGNGAIDPGETVTVQFFLRATVSNTVNLVATLQSNASITFPSGAQNYGVITNGAAAVGRPFTFVPNGVCGQAIQATLQLQDGAANLGTVSFSFVLGTVGTTIQVTNTTLITINDATSATPYPSSNVVSGFVGTPTKVTVTLNALSHTFLGDVDVLLVGPLGQKVMLMGSGGGGGPGVVNATFTFDDTAATAFPTGTIPASGTYRSANYNTNQVLPAPAPATPYGTNLSVFNGQNPNGAWQLWVDDHAGGDVGTIAGGWTLALSTVSNVCCLDPASTDLNLTATGSVNPVIQSNVVTYTMTVLNRGPGTATAVTLTNTVSPSATILSAIPSQGSVATNAGLLIASLGTLASNASATLTVTAVATGPGVAITNAARVVGAQFDFNPSANNSATVTTTLVTPNTWTNVNSGNWSNAVNWTSGIPPSSTTNIIRFNASGTTSYTANNDIGSNSMLLNGVVLNSSSSGNVALTGNTLQLSANGATAPFLQQSGSGSVTIGNNLTLAANANFGGDGNGVVTVNGAIDGTNVNLTKLGNSTFVLANSNSFGGTGRSVVINGGTLSIFTNENLGNVTNTVSISSNATLQVNGSTILARPITLGAGGGHIDVVGTNVVVLSTNLNGNFAFTKDGSGTLFLRTNSARTSVTNTLNAGTVWMNNQTGLGANNNATLMVLRSNSTFVYNDPANPILAYTFNLAGGTLQSTDNPGQRRWGGPVSVTGDSFISLSDANNSATNSDMSITNVLSGTNRLTIQSGATLGQIIISNNLNTYSGLLTLQSNVQLIAPSTNATSLGRATVELFGGSELDVQWGNTGRVVIVGVSTNGFTNANTNFYYTNDIVASGGGKATVNVSHPNAVGATLNNVVNNNLIFDHLTLNGSQLNMNGQSGYSLKFSNTTTLNGAGVINNSTNMSLNGVIVDGANPGTLTKTGVGVLFITNQNNNSYSLGTVLNQGVLQAVAGPNTNTGVIITNVLGTGGITLNGGTLQLRSDTNQTIGPGVGYDVVLASNATINVDRWTASGGTTKVLKLGSLFANTNLLTVSAGNTYQLDFANPMYIGGDAAISNTSSVSLDSGIVETNGSGNNFTKLGGGTLFLTNFSSNIYSGATFANQGTIRIHLNSNNAANALGPVPVLTLNGGTIDVRDSGLGNVFGPGPSGYSILVNSNSGLNVDRVNTTQPTSRYVTNNNLTINGGTSLTNATALTVGAGNNWSIKIVGTTTLNGYSAFQINGARATNAGALELIGPIVDGASPGVLVKRGTQPLGYSASNNPTFSGGTFITNGAILWQATNLPSTNLPGRIVYQFGTGDLNLDGGGSFNFANNLTSNYFFSNNVIVNYQVPSSLISNYGGGILDFTPTANNPRVTNLGSILLRGPLTVNAGGNGYTPTAPVATLQGPVTLAGSDRTIYVNSTGNGGSRVTFTSKFGQDGEVRNLNLVANNNAYMVFSGTNNGFLGDFNIGQSFIGNIGKVGFTTNAALPGGKVNVASGTVVTYASTEPTTLLNTLGSKFSFAPNSILTFGVLGTVTISNDFNLAPGGPFNGGAGADLRLGATDGGTVTYTGNITPFANEYKVGGGAATVVFSRNNQFTGARSLNVGPNPYLNAVAGASGSTVQISTSNNFTGGTLVNPGSAVLFSIGGTNTPLGTGTVESYGTIQVNGLNGSFAQAGLTSANNNNSQFIFHPGANLVLDNTGNNSQNSNRWGDTTPINLNGSTLTFQKSGNSTNSGGFPPVVVKEVVGTIGFAGGSQLSLLGNTANAAVASNAIFTLTAPDLVRVGAGTLEFNPNNNSNLFGGTNIVQFFLTNTASPTLALTNGLLAPYLVGLIGSNSSAVYLTYNPVSGFTNAVPTITVPANAAFPSLGAGTDYVEVLGTSTNISSGASVINALKLTGTSTLVGSGAGSNLTINSGGLLASGTVTVTNMNLRFGSAGTSEALIFVQSGGTATLANSVINAGAVTKFGAGTLALQADNAAYNGGYNVNRGVLAVNTTSTLNNSTNSALGQTSGANLFNLNGGVGLSFRATNNNLVYAGGKITSVDNNVIGFTFGGGTNIVQTYASGLDLTSVPGTNGVNSALGSKLLFQIQGDRTKAVIGGPVTLVDHAILEVQNTTRTLGGGSNRISFGGGLIATNKNLVKYGLGTLELPTDNSSTFSGSIMVNGGVLAVGHNGALGNSLTTLQPGTVMELMTPLVNYQPSNTIVLKPGSAERWTGVLNRFSDLTSPELFAVASNVNLQIGLNLTNLVNKTIQLNGGSLEAFQFVDDSRATAITLSNTVTVQLAADSKIGQSGVGLGRAGVTFTNNALITETNGSHSLTKIGLDVVVLGNAGNNYTGGTILREGVLRLGAGNAIPAVGGLIVTNQAVLDLNSFNQTVNSLRGNGNIFNSATNIPGFTIINTDASSFSGQITGNLSVIKKGTGSLLLTGTNGFDGGVQINGGDLIVGIESQSLNTALGRFDNTVVIGGAARLLTVGSFTVPQSLTIDDPIFGGPKAIGTTTPGVTSTFTGNVNLLDGVTLTVATNSRVNFTGNFSQAGTTAYGLTKEGSGTVNLTGVNVYTGDTFVNDGTLLVNNGTNGSALGNGTVYVDLGSTLGGSGRIAGPVFVIDGTVKPGNSAGALKLDSDLNLQSSAKMSFEIGGLIATNDYDVVTVGGTANFDGTLQLTLINNFLPPTNTTFKLIEYAVNGGTTFANALSSGARINTTDNLGSFRVSYGSTSLTADQFRFTDSDNDGIYNAWAMKYFGVLSLANGSNATDRFGDYDGDGQNNYQEFIAGTIPTDFNSAFKVTTALVTNTSNFAVTWTTAAETTFRTPVYQIQYSGDMVGWTTVVNPVITTNAGVAQWIDDGSLTGGTPPLNLPTTRFYHVNVK